MAVNGIEKRLATNTKAFVAFVRKRVGDRQLAEDVVQECLLKALKSAKVPPSDEELVVWFYRILRRAIIDVYRRRDSRARMIEAFRASLPEMPEPADEKTLCQCFRRLLPDLDEKLRVLVDRVDLRGESPAKVAADLGITVNNLHVRLHRARKQLKTGLVKTCRACSKHGCLDCTCR